MPTKSAPTASDGAHSEEGDDIITVTADEICAAMQVSPLRVTVKGVRPIRDDAEYHGLYVSEGRSHEITVWMYTAKLRQVVKPRTLLRTLIHELVHHLDYNKLGLEESYHTDGFFKRESSLVRQVESAARRINGVAPGRTGRKLALKSVRANDAR